MRDQSGQASPERSLALSGAAGLPQRGETPHLRLEGVYHRCFSDGLLVNHIWEKEELLLPIYEGAGTIPGGSPILFTGEHKRTREPLAE